MADLNARDARLVQWLNEAHAKEAELEADLTAHIALTEKPAYKKRLQQHLKETRDHKRKVSSRIKKLGGTATTGPNLPIVPGAVGEAAGKAVAAVKGQVGMARAVITEQAETHLRNAQEELREEHVEIAIYTRLETLAEAVGDRETARLAKTIRRDEERMAKFLDAELKRLVKEVVRAEIPANERKSAGRSTSRKRASTKPAARKTSARKSTKSSSSQRSGPTAKSKAKKPTSSSRSGSTRSRTAKSRSTRSRSGSRS